MESIAPNAVSAVRQRRAAAAAATNVAQDPPDPDSDSEQYPEQHEFLQDLVATDARLLGVQSEPSRDAPDADAGPLGDHKESPGTSWYKAQDRPLGTQQAQDRSLGNRQAQERPPGNPEAQPRLGNHEAQPRLGNQEAQPRFGNPEAQPRLGNPEAQPRLGTLKPKSVLAETQAPPGTAVRNAAAAPTLPNAIIDDLRPAGDHRVHKHRHRHRRSRGRERRRRDVPSSSSGGSSSESDTSDDEPYEVRLPATFKLPASYDGSANTLETFLFQVETTFKRVLRSAPRDRRHSAFIDDEAKCSAVINALTGQSLSVAQNCVLLNGYRYADLIRNLQEFCCEGDAHELVDQQFFDCRQSQGETASAFYTRWAPLFSRYALIFGAVTQLAKIHFFKRALTPGFQSSVVTLDLSSYPIPDGSRFAAIIQHVRRMDSVIRNAQWVSPMSINAIRNSETARCYSCKKLGHIATRCPELNAQPAAEPADELRCLFCLVDSHDTIDCRKMERARAATEHR